jgi:hypothetical protein
MGAAYFLTADSDKHLRRSMRRLTLPHFVTDSKQFPARARTRFFFVFITKTTCFLFSATNCANVHFTLFEAVGSWLSAFSETD